MNASSRAECVVAGAGIAGIAAAWQLACGSGIREVVLVDPRPPLSLTSDKSTECFRNWWPHPGMVALVERSLELLAQLEQHQPGRLTLHRPGYLYLTASQEGQARLMRQAQAAREAGAGPLRERTSADPPSFPNDPGKVDLSARGADLYFDSRVLQTAFPWVKQNGIFGVHVRQAGWFSAQQLGMLLLEEARAAGVKLLEAEVADLELAGGQLAGVWLRDSQGTEFLKTPSLIVATGPLLPECLARWGHPLPLTTEAHFKCLFDDADRRLPRPAPLVIWSDPIELTWGPEELGELASDPSLAFLLEPLPAGAHFRPEGGSDSTRYLLLWNFDATPTAFVPEPQPSEWHVPVVLYGIARMIPDFAPYLERGPKPFVDGGFYTFAPDELPLLGPLSSAADGIHIFGALGGYGIMTALGAAELVVQNLLGESTPSWARDFLPARLTESKGQAPTSALGAKL